MENWQAVYNVVWQYIDFMKNSSAQARERVFDEMASKLKQK